MAVYVAVEDRPALKGLYSDLAEPTAAAYQTLLDNITMGWNTPRKVEAAGGSERALGKSYNALRADTARQLVLRGSMSALLNRAIQGEIYDCTKPDIEAYDRLRASGVRPLGFEEVHGLARRVVQAVLAENPDLP